MIKWLFKKDNKQNKTDNGSAASSGDNSDATNISNTYNGCTFYTESRSKNKRKKRSKNNQKKGNSCKSDASLMKDKPSGSDTKIPFVQSKADINAASTENNRQKSFLDREKSKNNLIVNLVEDCETISCELFSLCNIIEIGSRTFHAQGFKIDTLSEFSEISMEEIRRVLDKDAVQSTAKFKRRYGQFCKELENNFPKYTTRREFSSAFSLLRNLMSDLAAVLESIDKENQCASALRGLSELNSSEDYSAEFDRIIQSYPSIKRVN